MLRAELSGNAYLAPAHAGRRVVRDAADDGVEGNDEEEPNWYVERPLEDARIIAAMVVGALREAYGVAHPQC